MKRALGYVRISKDEERSVSLDYQRAKIEKYCQRESLDLIGIEQHNGISGETIGKRPAVKCVLQAVDSHTIDAVVVFKSDRISRDGVESLQVERLFLKRGVAYLSTTEGNLTADSVDDKFMRYIRAGLNQRERKIISFRTRHALALKCEKGERIGGRPRYGWKVVNGEMIPDEGEQAAISRMRQLQLQKGYGVNEIVRSLKADGYRASKGTCFTKTHVTRILKAA